MSLSAKRRAILAKVESSYGVDSTPTGSANALLVTALDVSPMEAETTERNLIRPFFGQAERLMTQIYSKATFEIELAGHSGGIIGAMPKVDAVLRACGFAGTQKTIAISNLVQAAGTATATVGAHNYKVGDKVLISGATPSAFNGTQTITAITGTTFSFAIASGTASPATGTIIMNSAYEYLPISEGIPSLTIYYAVDGVLHKLTGCKGTVSLELAVKNVPKLKFEFTGLNNAAVDAANPVIDLSQFTTPQVANTQNTTNYSLLGYSGALESLNLGLNNQVQYVTLIGKEYVDVLDRKVSGDMTFEAPTIAEKDFWTAAKNQTTGALNITHGSQNSNKVVITCPKVLLDSPKYSEANNVMMMSCGVSVMPTTGNDEITLNFQ